MRITEGQLRRIIREEITSEVGSHSQGWIDPEGGYHYDPEMPDHGEWAAHKLVDLGMRNQLLDAIQSEVDRLGRYLSSPPRMPPTENIGVIYQAMSWIAGDVAKDMLLGLGWAAITNAYEISAPHPSRAIIDRWLDLGMEAEANPDGPFTIHGNNRVLVSGNMEEIEKFSRRLRR